MGVPEFALRTKLEPPFGNHHFTDPWFFFRVTNCLMKMLRNFPQKFWAFLRGTPKRGAKRTLPPGGDISYCRFLPQKGPKPEEIVSRGGHLKWCLHPPRRARRFAPLSGVLQFLLCVNKIPDNSESIPANFPPKNQKIIPDVLLQELRENILKHQRFNELRPPKPPWLPSRPKVLQYKYFLSKIFFRGN